MKKLSKILFIIFLMGPLGSCLNMTGGTGGEGLQTKLYAYVDLSSGCYGDPEDPELEGKLVHLNYSISIVDSETLMVCVSVPGYTALNPSILLNKTIVFYGTSGTPPNPGDPIQNLKQAIPIPVLEGSENLFLTGSGSPCPDGTPSTLVGYLDMKDYSPLSSLFAVDACGSSIGASASPLEVKRQIDRGFR